jgi:hypothetical protein
MGQVNRDNQFINRCFTFSTASMAIMVGKRGGGLADRSSGVLCIRMEPFFLCSSDSVQLYWVSMKGCRVWYVIGAYISCVSGFSCRMYIDSNRRESRI